MKAIEKNSHKRIFFIMVAAILICLCQMQLMAQDEKEPKEETKELITPRLTFISVQKNDQTIDLKVTVKSKEKNTFNPLDGLTIQFFNATNAQPTLLGKGVTDLSGITFITISSNNVVLDEEGKMRFTAQFSGNDKLSEGEAEVYVKKARLEIHPIKEDSALSVQVHLADTGQPEEIAIAEVDIGVFVQRTFLPLKVGEGASDENGELLVEFPSDLPGDENGNLTIIARVEDNEEYGNLEANIIAAWGVPVSYDVTVAKGELWSPSPPLWMLLTFFILMTAVWSHYFVIIYKLVKLKNL